MSIIQKIIAIPYNDYYQLMRDIEKFCRDKQSQIKKSNSELMSLHGHNEGRELLRIKPSTTLNFPENDILNITINEHSKYEITLSFLGLYGVDSPLPHYWLVRVMEDNETSKMLCAFLDIFNPRLYHLLYLAWKKTQTIVLLEQGKNGYLNYLQFLSGNLLNEADTAEFAYAGLLGQRVHSACTLKYILRDYLNNVDVTILQFVSQWVCIKTILNLTHNCDNELCLGNNSLLGSRVLEASSKIVIILGPVSYSYALQLLIDDCGINQLHSLIKRYLGFYYEYTLELKVLINNKCLVLGIDNMSLGRIVWLGDAWNLFFSVAI